MNSLTQKNVFIGIDWADQTHAWHLENDGAQIAGTLKQDAAAIQTWIQQLLDRALGMDRALGTGQVR